MSATHSVLADEVSITHHVAAAVGNRGLAPARQCSLGSGDSLQHLTISAQGQLSDNLLGCLPRNKYLEEAKHDKTYGVVNGHGLRCNRVTELTIDEHLGARCGKNTRSAQRTDRLQPQVSNANNVR